jgi:hypothetical protein
MIDRSMLSRRIDLESFSTIAIRRYAPSYCLPILLVVLIHDPQQLATLAKELDLPFRRHPHGLHALEAESPADKLPIAEQESLGAEHRIGETEFAQNLQDDVLDRAAGMADQL